MICRTVAQPEDGGNDFGVIDMIDLDNLPLDLPFATVDARAGKAAYEYVERAVSYALKHRIHARGDRAAP